MHILSRKQCEEASVKGIQRPWHTFTCVLSPWYIFSRVLGMDVMLLLTSVTFYRGLNGWCVQMSPVVTWEIISEKQEFVEFFSTTMYGSM